MRAAQSAISTLDRIRIVDTLTDDGRLTVVDGEAVPAVTIKQRGVLLDQVVAASMRVDGAFTSSRAGQ